MHEAFLKAKKHCFKLCLYANELPLLALRVVIDAWQSALLDQPISQKH